MAYNGFELREGGDSSPERHQIEMVSVHGLTGRCGKAEVRDGLQRRSIPLAS